MCARSASRRDLAMAALFARTALLHRAATVLGLSLLLVWALVGCATGLSTPPVPGSPQLNGCQTQTVPNYPPADVVLTGASSQSTPTAQFTTQGAMTQGQTLDVHLAATVNWRLTTPPDTSVLQVLTTQSWYDASDKTCIWRMQAVGSGNTQMEFTGGLVCAPGDTCPAIAGDARFTI